MLIALRLLQPLKAEEPISMFSPKIFTSVKTLHPENTKLLILFTSFGMSILQLSLPFMKVFFEYPIGFAPKENELLHHSLMLFMCSSSNAISVYLSLLTVYAPVPIFAMDPVNVIFLIFSQ